MELHKLHVAQFRSCAPRHRHAVRRGHLGVSSVRIDHACSARCQQHRASRDLGSPPVFVECFHSHYAAVVQKKVAAESKFAHANIAELLRVLEESPSHLPPS